MHADLIFTEMDYTTEAGFKCLVIFQMIQK